MTGDARGVPREFAGYLPLSAKPRHDESSVNGDWGPRFAVLLGSIDEMFRTMPADVAGRPDVVASHGRLSSAVAAVESGRRVRVPALGAVLVEALEVSALSGCPLVVDSVTSGAVALDRSLRAPMPIRAVASGR
ncbi:MAG: hypothetical protein ABIR65_00270, partial [Pseudolysinimonas sp.]